MSVDTICGLGYKNRRMAAKSMNRSTGSAPSTWSELIRPNLPGGVRTYVLTTKIMHGKLSIDPTFLRVNCHENNTRAAVGSRIGGVSHAQPSAQSQDHMQIGVFGCANYFPEDHAARIFLSPMHITNEPEKP